MFQARDRTQAPMTAPAEGLYLTEVHYTGPLQPRQIAEALRKQQNKIP
jgi:tRNA U38,U39,U40 pseudouridine synthase TruA